MFSTLTLSLTFVGMMSVLNTYFNAVDSQDTTCTVLISITPLDQFNYQ